MSSAKCFHSIKNFKPTPRTRNGIKELDRLANMGSYLQKLIVLIPFFGIFVGRDTYSIASFINYGWQVSQTDWVTFDQALAAAPEITRTKINAFAEKEWFVASGNDALFWRCVANATK
ncbi:hypothetical protein [uncultured Shewanella sp.]|uniref:hypothetical protein n=1 Tax=uncultured Shewanella sp. TaxID=173975 RepID=UPI00262244C3|nr:hypothetical protein [uncultured Shewanella sp.]